MPEIQLTPASRGGPRLSTRRRKSSASRRALRVLAIALIAAGTIALLDAAVTLLWQEPFSALYAKLRQDHLNGALAKVDRATPNASEQRALVDLADVRRRVAFLAGSLEGHAKNGSAVGRIEIPRIGADFVVVKGTGTSELESGPGVYSETVFPGMAGTTAIAGHRTTYLAPFRHIDELRKGSAITLRMPYARFTYNVVDKRVVSPSNVAAAVDNVGYSRLVLSACTPLFSAAKRLLVYARLTRVQPLGAARVPAADRPAGAEETLSGDQLEEPASALAKAPMRARPSLPGVLESVQPHLTTIPGEH
jgi:sortase A